MVFKEQLICDHYILICKILIRLIREENKGMFMKIYYIKKNLSVSVHYILSICMICTALSASTDVYSAEETLFEAIRSHNEKKVKELILHGVNFHACEDGKSAIEEAIDEMCIRNDASASMEPKHIRACKLYDTHFNVARNIVQYLLEAGAKPSNWEWLTRIMVISGSVPYINLMINKQVDLKKQPGLLLEAAESKNNEEMIKILLKLGLDINYQNSCGQNVLMRAVRNSDETMVRTILRQFGTIEPKKVSTNSIINAQDNSKQTVLMYAAKGGDVLILQLLLDAGASINQKDKYGRTALMYAAWYGHKAAVKVLLKNKANLHIKSNEFGKATALTYAILGDETNIVELLLNQGFNIEEKDADGQTPLHIAVGSKGYIRHRSALYHMIIFLLKKGANVNATDKKGQTPLINYMCRNKDLSIDIFMHLMKYGANPSIKDKDGKKALDYLKEYIDRDISEILKMEYSNKNAIKDLNAFYATIKSLFHDPKMVIGFFAHDSIFASKYDREKKLTNGIVIKTKKFQLPGIDVSTMKFRSDATEVDYPIFSGFKDLKIQSTVNTKIKDLFLKNAKEFVEGNVHCNFQIWVGKNLIVIMKDEDFEGLHTAHGYDTQESFFIDATSGIFYDPLTLFKTEVNFKGVIAACILKFDESDPYEREHYQNCTYDGFSINNNFVITDNGIKIYFDRYDGVWYGDRTFTIPWNKIIHVVDTNGSLYKSFSQSEENTLA